THRHTASDRDPDTATTLGTGTDRYGLVPRFGTLADRHRLGPARPALSANGNVTGPLICVAGGYGVPANGNAICTCTRQGAYGNTIGSVDVGVTDGDAAHPACDAAVSQGGCLVRKRNRVSAHRRRVGKRRGSTQAVGAITDSHVVITGHVAAGKA